MLARIGTCEGLSWWVLVVGVIVGLRPYLSFFHQACLYVREFVFLLGCREIVFSYIFCLLLRSRPLSKLFDWICRVTICDAIYGCRNQTTTRSRENAGWICASVALQMGLARYHCGGTGR